VKRPYRRRGLLRDSPNAFERAKGRFLDFLVIALLIGLAFKGVAALIDWLKG
jgi:hypothetical protein